jgi:hypothetical protein
MKKPTTKTTTMPRATKMTKRTISTRRTITVRRENMKADNRTWGFGVCPFMVRTHFERPIQIMILASCGERLILVMKGHITAN